MVDVVPQYRSMTEDEYYALETRATVKHEYYYGEIFAMAGASPEHALLTANLSAELHNCLRGKPCYVNSSDQRIKVGPTGLITYPDITIVCPPPRYDPIHPDLLLNPRALAEVLSTTTEKYDRTLELDHYKQIESLTDYILVEQDQVRVEHFHRNPGGEWIQQVFRARQDRLILPDLEIDVPLDLIYDRLERPEGLPENR